jgi:hypothetical protein
MKRLIAGIDAVCCAIASSAALAAEEDLAKKLANPVAALVSVPFQYNYDEKIGVDEHGRKNYVNVQPVIPFTLNADWNRISRTIHPSSISATSSRPTIIIGDIVQSLFSPAKPTAGGVIWGVGPALLLPTATDDRLGGEKWGIGPTGVAFKQEGPWTYGILANHLWSVAGNDQRADVSATFLQSFLTYITQTKTTFSINTKSTNDWKARQWSVPLNMVVSQLLKLGDQPLQLGVGARYWAAIPTADPKAGAPLCRHVALSQVSSG